MSQRIANRARSDLVDQRDALLRSIEDLERERSAGDLDDGAFAVLHAEYVARTAEVLRALASLSDADGGATGDRGTPSLWRRSRQFLGRRGPRRVLGVGATLCVLVAIALVATLLAGVRLPGEEETGGVVIPQKSQVQQDLAQAEELANADDLNQAIQLYDAVLRDVPDQPEALTYRGWLERLVGRADSNVNVVTLGDESLADAAKIAPGYADAHGLYGIALLEDGGAKALPLALAQFETFCADRGSAEVLAGQGTTMAEAFVSAHEPVPTLLRPYEKGPPDH
jgi:hypothetical protein